MSDSRWLVKSSGRVLGPWDLNTLIENIRAKNISLLDEVKEPQSRWLFAREHASLKDIVKEIREIQANTIENTQSTFVTSGKTITVSVTERLFQESELTPVPSADGLVEIKGNERTVVGAALGQNSFGALTDKKVQKKLASSKMNLNILLYAIAGLMLVGGLLLIKGKSKPSLSGEQAEALFKDAQELAGRGDFQRALESVERIETARVLSGSESLLKIKILLSLDGPTEIEINRILEGLRPDPKNGFVNLELIRGLVQARLGHPKEALGNFQEALQTNVQYEEVQLNLAASYFLANDLPRAMGYLRAIRNPRNKSYFGLLKGLVALKWDNSAQRVANLSQTFEELRAQVFSENKDKSRESNYDFRFELTLLLTSLAQKLGYAAFAEDFKKKLVQMSPFESAHYIKSPLLDWTVVDWKELLEQCQQVGQASRDSAPIRGIQSLCLAASGNLISARNAIELARKQFAEDSVLIGVDALLLLQAGRKAEAERLVDSAQSGDRYLSIWVKAMVCEDKLDFGCVEQNWEQIRAMDALEPRSYFGLARVAKDMANESKFISSSNQGLRFAPNYRPLLQLTGGRFDF